MQFASEFLVSCYVAVRVFLMVARVFWVNPRALVSSCLGVGMQLLGNLVVDIVLLEVVRALWMVPRVLLCS